jgi:quercetin dioxygenase-like cupin family protein
VRRAWPLMAMVGGLVVLAVAATMLVRSDHDAQPIAAAIADPAAITLSARDVSVVTQVYEPGQNSGWHAHPGIHAVAVLSGTLTVYDGQCERQTFEAGQPYVGGQLPHLVQNETDAAVTLAVTYLSPPEAGMSTEHTASPDGCTPG